MERLLGEMEFNRMLAFNPRVGAVFEMLQFRRALADGTFVWLADNLRTKVHSAYGAMAFANGLVDGYLGQGSD